MDDKTRYIWLTNYTSENECSQSIALLHMSNKEGKVLNHYTHGGTVIPMLYNGDKTRLKIRLY
jgi:hypothetical protein